MEKLQDKKQKQKQNSATKSWSPEGNSNLWDCGSTLYDSFELNSFKRQLDSAICNSPKTLSMPHLPERRLPQLETLPEPHSPSSRKSFNISRSFQKFLRSVFKSNKKSSTTTANFQVPDKYSKERFYMLFDKSEPVLSTIPEVSEFDIGAFSPEIFSLLGRSASERSTYGHRNRNFARLGETVLI
ncbi:hypothetical protein VNO77_41348 [Canavalia gladiata]|uniref:Uncharacterized protein n=1 Tax=Canavalia gladiata TaxID=3824 RepID=A0AAN9PRU1_CANGL